MEQVYGLTVTAERDRRTACGKHSPDAIESLNSTSPGRLGAVLALALILTGTAPYQAHAGNGGGGGHGGGATMSSSAAGGSRGQNLPTYRPVPTPQPAPAPVTAGSGGSAYGQSAGSGFGASGYNPYPASGYGSSNPGTIYGPPVPAPQPGAQPYPTGSGASGYGQYAGSGYGPPTSGLYPAAAYSAADYAPATAAAGRCPMTIYAAAPYGAASPTPQAPSLYAGSSGASFCNTNPAYNR
jgi:hypothetical protein